MHGTGRRAAGEDDTAVDLVDRLGALVLPTDADDDLEEPIAPDQVEVAP